MVIAGLSVAPTAAADCTSSGGTTICAQGTVSGGGGSGPTGSGPTVPYPCDYDWYCDDTYGVYWNADLDWDPGPGIGLPGTPGNRPDIGGGGGNRPSVGGGGRGGGRR
ncbi:MAG: hypothetical protein WBB00_29625 [Mycobacterium sp.]